MSSGHEKKRTNKHSQQSDISRNVELVQQVQGIIDENPGKSMRAVANQLHVMRRLFISNSTRENRVIRSKRLLSNIRHLGRPTMFWYFSDENNFVQDQKANRKYDKWMCASLATTPTVIHNKLPSFVMVLGVMSNESHVMLLYSLLQDLRVISRYWTPLSRSRK